MLEVIDDFRFEYRWLSNFHECEIIHEGIVYPSTEHAYQAAKSLDLEFRKEFAKLPKPKDAKREGKNIDLRPDWEKIKNEVMYDVCWYKFTQHPELKQKLIETGFAELIEGNHWGDEYWGVCNGKGKNVLGNILMAIRRFLIRSEMSFEEWTKIS